MVPHPRLLSIFNHLLHQPVRIIHLALGELFPVDEDQVRAQWNELSRGTVLAQAQITVRTIRAEQQCMVCFEMYHPLERTTSCPRCGCVGAKILVGEEFFLESTEE